MIGDPAHNAETGRIKLSVIVPCLNAEDTIGAQLTALADQDWSEPWEVIVADNGSADGSLEIARKFVHRLPELRIVDASQRKGSAYARNKGAAAARGDWLAFCDADDVVAPGWVAAMTKALQEHDFVASRFKDGTGNDGRRARRVPQQNGLQEYTYPRYLPHSAGSGLGVRAALHRKVGGFDETFLRLQDTDYCWRIQLMGVKLHFAPEAVIHYRLRASSREALQQAYQWGEYNVRLYAKYREFGMPRLTLKDGVKRWVALIRRVPHLADHEKREQWLWQFSWRLGRVIGFIKYRLLRL